MFLVPFEAAFRFVNFTMFSPPPEHLRKPLGFLMHRCKRKINYLVFGRRSIVFKVLEHVFRGDKLTNCMELQLDHPFY